MIYELIALQNETIAFTTNLTHNQFIFITANMNEIPYTAIIINTEILRKYYFYRHTSS